MAGLTSDLRKLLHEFGYRPIDEAAVRWGKPVGFTLLIIRTDVSAIAQHFYSRDGELHTWAAAQLDLTASPDELHRKIALFESYEARCDLVPYSKTFAFLSCDEWARNIADDL